MAEFRTVSAPSVRIFPDEEESRAEKRRRGEEERGREAERAGGRAVLILKGVECSVTMSVAAATQYFTWCGY